MTAERPSITAGLIDVKLSDGTITIRGYFPRPIFFRSQDYLVSERRYDEFQRTLTLPSGIDADFTNGVLTVTLPKSVEAKRKERKVEIRTAA